MKDFSFMAEMVKWSLFCFIIQKFTKMFAQNVQSMAQSSALKYQDLWKVLNHLAVGR